mmetsp:Transcript_97650/g.209535  ORF Transcript_97650/g.209535 Transcript_97650/m.209535 type:complete len:373 (+) Transcript_97650:84-1202(+)
MKSRRYWIGPSCSGHAVIAAAGLTAIAISLQGCGRGTGENCSDPGTNCAKTGCCSIGGMKCYEKNQYWSSCRSSCSPGVQADDPSEDRTPWSCRLPGESPAPAPVPTPFPTPAPVPGWTMATWTTGYWDCCKPSCAWADKGNVLKPALACNAKTGESILDPNVESVCNGGTASSCTSNRPFVVNEGLSMGFAAAAASGKHGLTGDDNCGQCFELRFLDEHHPHGDWGGASPGLVGKTMVIQVTNIGYDVTGQHSFDLQIPGAGQGAFTQGCTVQFEGYKVSDFDCGERYGGCKNATGCKRLPPQLRQGCEWRFEWLRWLHRDSAGGQTNNPYAMFRRVSCPHHLTTISGTKPTDDDGYPVINVGDYKSSVVA